MMNRMFPHSDWAKWYAWYPVKIQNEWYWLTTVYRKKLYFHTEGAYVYPPWKYATLFDILKG